jgi:pteridine reductase
MPKYPLSGKVALITGAARRIGAEIARTLHARQMNVILHYNSSEEDANQLCQELNLKRENSAVTVRAALQEEESDKYLVNESMKSWGRLDVLINNASRFYRTVFGEVTEYAWEDLMNSNLRGPFFLSQAAAPHLRKTKGSIINITDIHAERPLRDYSVYCVSKSGLIMMTKALAKELGPDVRVNAISPGNIIWPEGGNVLDDEQKRKIVEATSLRRSGNASDVAKAVLFFICDAEYITGEVLNVDGGRMLG